MSWKEIGKSPYVYETQYEGANYMEKDGGSDLNLNKRFTNRGFEIIEFKDRYDSECSIQKSSLATENAIWFGIDNADPQIMASKTKEGGTGWVSYEISSDVLLNTRMHLTQEQVKELLPILTEFADTGELNTGSFR